MKYLTQSYVVIVPDDELMIGASLELACNLLDSNKEVLSVGGHTVSIQKYGFLYKVDSIYENHLNYNNHSNETKKRLSYHFGTSEPIIRKADCYRVMRIELLECIAKIVQCMPESECVYLFEVIAEIVLTAKGKSLYTNQILWLRNWVRPASTSKEVRSNYFYQWIEKDLVNRIRLKSALRAFLPEINPLDIEFAIDLAYRNRKIAEMHEISRLERAPRDDIARKVVRYLRSFPWLLKHPNGIRLSPQLKEFVSENSTYAELMEGVRQIIWVSK
jgi:hypothetical protein